MPFQGTDRDTQIGQLVPEEVPLLRTDIPGPQSSELWRQSGANHSPGLSPAALESRLVMRRGSGCLVEDVDGNVFLDFCSGAIVNVLGHSHPELVRAIQEEMNNFIHIYDWLTEARSELFTELASVTPAEITQFQMFTGGTETVEAALRLGMASTRKKEFIGFHRAYHGKSLASRSLTGGAAKKGYGPTASGYYQTMNAYCYRCPLSLKPETCGAACADEITNVFEQETSGDVAGVIVEPIQGAGGIIVPPKEFLEKIAAFCKRNDILLIFDEILTSFGRTGKLFAHEHYKIEPDIMTMGKGLGGGYPVGMVGSSEELMDVWPWNQPTGGSTTFGGGNVAARAVLTTLEIIREERLLENATAVGRHIRESLEEMKTRYSVIGDVRGQGMLIGVEFVQDRDSKKPITLDHATEFYRAALDRGLLLNTIGPIARIAPPLTMTIAQADRGIEILDEACNHLEQTVSLQD